MIVGCRSLLFSLEGMASLLNAFLLFSGLELLLPFISEPQRGEKQKFRAWWSGFGAVIIQYNVLCLWDNWRQCFPCLKCSRLSRPRGNSQIVSISWFSSAVFGQSPGIMDSWIQSLSIHPFCNGELRFVLIYLNDLSFLEVKEVYIVNPQSPLSLITNLVM